MVEKIYLTYDEIDNLCRFVLTKKILDSAETFDTIVGVTRGGLLPALILAESLNIKDVRSISISSYDDEKQGKLIQILKSEIPNSKRVLVVDDLIDSGSTLRYIKEKYPLVSTAVVYSKEINPPSDLVTYHAAYVNPYSWLVFPWE